MLIFVSFLISSNTYAVLGDGGTAGYYLVKSKVDYLSVNSSFIYFKPATDTPSNPGNCHGYDKAIIPGEHPMRKELMSIVLAAQTSGKYVKVWVTDCFEHWNSSFPQVSTIHLVN